MKWLAMSLLALMPLTAQADDNRPLTIELIEEASGIVRLRWKIPPHLDARQAPTLEAPASCTAREAVRAWSDALGHWQETRWHCAAGLGGQAIRIRHAPAAPSLATIARFTAASGAPVASVLLQPGEHRLAIPVPRAQGSGFAGFLQLGISHVWRGFDHLLFVAGLLFIAGSLRRVLLTVTAFTAAHSVTLALAALDILRLPARAVESVIALSILLLAVEIVKGPRDTLTWRHPTVVAASFGLLHGLGFAAVLREVGLPEAGTVTALLAFNLGIEAGQLLFAGVLLMLLAAVRRALAFASHAARLRTAGGYAVGALASYWMLARLLG